MRKKSLTMLLFIAAGIFACKESPVPSETILFTDLYDSEKIDSIRVFNNSGVHLVSDAKRSKFISTLEKISLDENLTAKMGAKRFILYVNTKEIRFDGRTHGHYFEAHASGIMKNNDWVTGEWIYFKTNGMNLDNY